MTGHENLCSFIATDIHLYAFTHCRFRNQSKALPRRRIHILFAASGADLGGNIANHNSRLTSHECDRYGFCFGFSIVLANSNIRSNNEGLDVSIRSFFLSSSHQAGDQKDSQALFLSLF
jgi:hypothetical protein